MTPADAEIVLGIYRQGIATGDATFETEVPAWEEWDRTHLVHSRIVAEMDSRVVGWAALSPVSDRCVYGGVAEVSVYVASGARGKGIGLALLDALVTSSESEGIWTLQAGLFPENVASVRIQERMGFRVVGVRERLGQLAGVWRDVLLMGRRSQVQGR